MSWIVHNADCLDFLRTLPAMSVDVVVTDPPYGINTKSDGAGKLNPWADLCNAAFWYAAWLKECRRVVKPTGCVWSFLNWRSLPTFQKAGCDLGWPIESLLVWNKEWIGPGGSRGLRPSYEMVALWTLEDFSIEDRGLPDIQTFKWCGHKPTGHPAEKPVALCDWLIESSSCPADGTVLDPFCGSGSTGVAAVQSGRNFIGIETDLPWAEQSRRRIAEAVPLFAEAAK